MSVIHNRSLLNRASIKGTVSNVKFMECNVTVLCIRMAVHTVALRVALAF